MTGRKRVRASTAQQALIGVLRVAGRLQQRLNDACAGFGITHDQYNVLRILRGVHPEGHPRYEVAQRLLSRAPDVTRLLDRLERMGLVERVRSAEDRRLSVSRVTAEGLALLAEADVAVAAVHDEFSQPLTQQQCRDLLGLCEALG